MIMKFIPKKYSKYDDEIAFISFGSEQLVTCLGLIHFNYKIITRLILNHHYIWSNSNLCFSLFSFYLIGLVLLTRKKIKNKKG